nr:MAG TPA: hypothetical protein [Bacteriophage sp.]
MQFLMGFCIIKKPNPIDWSVNTLVNFMVDEP